MPDRAWRTVVVESAADLRTEDGCLHINGDESKTVPIKEIRQMVVLSEAVTFSVGLINALTENGTTVVFCDKTYKPSAIVHGVEDHAHTAGNIIAQTRWSDEKKADVWQSIITQKIGNQSRLLGICGVQGRDVLRDFGEKVKPGDEDNIESVSARIYFRSLFGSDFIRHAESAANHALDYGYVIVCTAFTRILTLHGYNTALGIHHCSVNNRFNLSCDLMEPFRPFVDRVVYENGEREPDRDYKKLLIGVLHSRVSYKDKVFSFYDAAEAFTLDVIAFMNGTERTVGEVTFCPEKRK